MDTDPCASSEIQPDEVGTLQTPTQDENELSATKVGNGETPFTIANEDDSASVTSATQGDNAGYDSDEYTYGYDTVPPSVNRAVSAIVSFAQSLTPQSLRRNPPQELKEEQRATVSTSDDQDDLPSDLCETFNDTTPSTPETHSSNDVADLPTHNEIHNTHVEECEESDSQLATIGNASNLTQPIEIPRPQHHRLPFRENFSDVSMSRAGCSPPDWEDPRFAHGRSNDDYTYGFVKFYFGHDKY